MDAPVGANLFLASRFARSAHVPGDEWNQFRRAKSIDGFYGNPDTKDNDNLDPSGLRLRSVVVGRDFQLSIEERPTIESLLVSRVSHLRKITSRTELVDGVYRYELARLSPREVPAAFLGARDFLFDDNNGKPRTVFGAVLANHEIAMPSRERFSSKESWIALTDTELAPGEPDEGNSGDYTTHPQVFGRFSALAETKLPITVEVTDGAGVGFVGKVTAKLVDTVGVQKMTIVAFDKWLRLVLADGSGAGVSRKDDVYILLPSGAGTLTVGDKFTFNAPIALPNPAYPESNILDTAGSFVTLDGTKTFGGPPGETGFDSIGIKFLRGLEPRNSNGSLNAQGVISKGIFDIQFEFERPRDDDDFFRAIERAKLMQVKLDVYGDPLGGGFDAQWTPNFPTCEVKSVTRSVSSADTLKEKATVNAVFVDEDFTETFIAPFVPLPGFMAP